MVSSGLRAWNSVPEAHGCLYHWISCPWQLPMQLSLSDPPGCCWPGSPLSAPTASHQVTQQVSDPLPNAPRCSRAGRVSFRLISLDTSLYCVTISPPASFLLDTWSGHQAMPRVRATTLHNSRRGHSQRIQWSMCPWSCRTQRFCYEKQTINLSIGFTQELPKGRKPQTHICVYNPTFLFPISQVQRLRISPWSSMKPTLSFHYIQSLHFSRFIETSRPLHQP